MLDQVLNRLLMDIIGSDHERGGAIIDKDSGLLHTLLGISTKSIHRYLKVGASWEGFALEQVLFSEEIDNLDCYYWRTRDGAELDLLVMRGEKRIGYKFKYTDIPKLTPSMRIVLHDLSCQR